MVANNSYAITYTIKNEEQFLRDALSYHLANGCQKVYLYFDASDDRSREIAAAFDQRVETAESINPAALASPPEWIRCMLPFWDDNFDMRKRINTYVAALRARDVGIEWLFSIDADEILLFREPRDEGPGDSAGFLARIPANVPQVLVPPLEALPTGPGKGRPLVDCIHFINRFPATDLVWRSLAVGLRPFLKTPKQRAWLDYLVYWLRFRGLYPRLLRHPITAEAIPSGHYLAYYNHKSGIRTSAAEQCGFDTHMWTLGPKMVRSVRRGTLLHYDLPNAECFRNKFQQRSAWFTDRTKVFYTRHALAAVARELSSADADRFFIESIAITDPVRLKALVSARTVQEISCVADTLARTTRRNLSA